MADESRGKYCTTDQFPLRNLLRLSVSNIKLMQITGFDRLDDRKQHLDILVTRWTGRDNAGFVYSRASTWSGCTLSKIEIDSPILRQLNQLLRVS